MPWSFFDKNGNLKQAAANAVVPSAKATKSGTTAVTTATNTIIPFDTEAWDTDNIHDLVTNNSRLTCNTAGKYLVNAYAQFPGNATGYREANIKLNGSFAGGFTSDNSNAGSVDTMNVVVSGVLTLAVGDYIELNVYQTSGSTLNLTASSYLAMTKIDGAVYVPVAYPASLVGQEVAYAEITSYVAVASTTEATGTTIITAPAFTADGVSSYFIETFAQLITPSNAAGAFTIASIFEGATQIGRIMDLRTPAASNSVATLTGLKKITPTAGSHTYTLTAYVSSTTGGPTVGGAAGGNAAMVPAYIRITKAS